MLVEVGQKADCVCSYGMKLSWDINDPQMPQVRETGCARAHVALSIQKRAGGIQVLAETEERPLPTPTSLKVFDC